MAVYELGIASTATTTNTAMLEIMSSRAASILEFGLLLASSALEWDLRRPTNTPTGGTPQTASATTNVDGGGTSGLGIILSGWTLAPTGTGANRLMRAVRCPANTGMTMGWLPGQMVVGTTRDQSIIAFAQGTPLVNNRWYIRWEE